MASELRETVNKTMYNTTFEITRIYNDKRKINEVIEKAVASDSKIYSIETVNSL